MESQILPITVVALAWNHVLNSFEDKGSKSLETLTVNLLLEIYL